jgi:hypothetical protein
LGGWVGEAASCAPPASKVFRNRRKGWGLGLTRKFSSHTQHVLIHACSERPYSCGPARGRRTRSSPARWQAQRVQTTRVAPWIWAAQLVRRRVGPPAAHLEGRARHGPDGGLVVHELRQALEGPCCAQVHQVQPGARQERRRGSHGRSSAQAARPAAQAVPTCATPPLQTCRRAAGHCGRPAHPQLRYVTSTVPSARPAPARACARPLSAASEAPGSGRQAGGSGRASPGAEACCER